MGVSTTGKDAVATDGVDYDVATVGTANDPQEILGFDVSTSTIVLRAPSGNAGPIYIGFDTDVTTSNGFPIPADTGISIDIDNSEQQIFFVSANAGDELRYLAIN